MPKDPSEFTRQNTQRAIQAANFGMNWYREISEQNINQAKIAVGGVSSMLRKMVNELGEQSSAICRHSLSLAEETISNTFELGQKLVQAKEPGELLPLQSEYVARQAQAVADETKQLGEIILSGAASAANTTLAEGAANIREHPKAA